MLEKSQVLKNAYSCDFLQSVKKVFALRYVYIICNFE